MVKLPNMNYNLQNAKEKATNREQKVLEAFPAAGFVKEDAAEALGISVSGTYKLLSRMNEKGLLKASKEGRQWIYSAVQ